MIDNIDQKREDKWGGGGQMGWGWGGDKRSQIKPETSDCLGDSLISDIWCPIPFLTLSNPTQYIFFQVHFDWV